MNKKVIITAMVMALSLGLMACGGNNDTVPPVVETPSGAETGTSDVETPVDSQTPTNNTGSNVDETMMSAVEVFDKYVAEFPELKFEEMELDKDSGKYYYKLEGSDSTGEYEFKINAHDGSLIKKEMDKEIDFSGEITKEHVAKIDSFVDQALADAGADAKLDEWTLKFDDGIVKIEIEIDMPDLSDLEYKYDVNTGALLEKDN